MPIYEYRCQNCGHEFDELQKISDAPLKKCPKCGQDTLTKLVSAAGFQLKGSGWYATDFKDKGKKPKAKEKEEKTPEACKECPAKKDKSCPASDSKTDNK